ncbi:MAG: LLM class flavin-dependent oxidoreductase [Chloroflexi bacterium]|nr:LLM class flavin-dependent oxidoreductase [Chloroflexota bacterium]
MSLENSHDQTSPSRSLQHVRHNELRDLRWWTIAAGLGAVTKRLRLGCLVSGVTYRHPAMLAKVTATVDQISHGRLELGIGAAWSKDDHIAYGLDFPSLKERQERLEEALAIIDSLWTQPSTTFIGKHYQVRDAVFEPKPVQKPRPPILIAAVGDRGIALTAKYAQIWASVSTPGFARQCIERIEAQCKAIGRDPREIEYSQYIGLMLSNDRRKVREAVEGRMKMLEAAARRPVMAQGRNALDGESAEARVRGSLLAGNGEEIREQVQRYVDVGVTHIILMTPRPFDRALVEKFRKGVMEGFIV